MLEKFLSIQNMNLENSSDLDSNLFYLYRISADFSPITSLCSNNKHIILFRKNKTVNIVDIKLEKVIFNFHTNSLILQAYFIKEDQILCRTESDGLLILKLSEKINNGHSFNVLKDSYNKPITSTKIFTFNKFIPTKSIIFADNKNLFEICFNNNVICKMRFKSPIVFFTKIGSYTFISFENFDFKIYTEKETLLECLIECKFDAIVTSVSKVNNKEEDNDDEIKKVVLSFTNGKAILFECKHGLLLDTVEIRNTKVISVIVEDLLYASGADSRTVIYRVGSKLTKLIQNTAHSSEVLFMIEANGLCWTGGEDAILVKNVLLEDSKLRATRIYDSPVKTGVFSFNQLEYFYILNSKSLNIFYYTENAQKDQSDLICNNPTNISLKSMFIEKLKINQTVKEPTHYLYFNLPDSYVITGKVSSNGEFFVYSTNKGTFIYRLRNNSDIFIECIKTINEVSFDFEFIVKDNSILLLYLTYKSLNCFNLTNETFHSSTKVDFTYHRILIALDDKVVLVSKKVDIFKVTDNDSILKVKTFDKTVTSDICNCYIYENFIYFITATDKNINGFSLENNQRKSLQLKFVTDYGNYPEMIINNKYVKTPKNIILLESNKIYNLHPVIHDIHFFNNKILVIQSFWEHVKKKFKNGVFKMKFSNK